MVSWIAHALARIQLARNSNGTYKTEKNESTVSVSFISGLNFCYANRDESDNAMNLIARVSAVMFRSARA
jgi:hypothetical protein